MISRNCCSKTRYVFLEKSHFWVHGTMVFWKNTLRIPHFAPKKHQKNPHVRSFMWKTPELPSNPTFHPPQNRASRGLPSHGIHRLYICRAQRLLESQCIVSAHGGDHTLNIWISKFYQESWQLFWVAKYSCGVFQYSKLYHFRRLFCKYRLLICTN